MASVAPGHAVVKKKKSIAAAEPGTSFMDQLGLGPNKYDKQGVPRIRQNSTKEADASAKQIAGERARVNAAPHSGRGFFVGTGPAPTPARTPAGPGPKKAPSTAPAVTAKKSVVATPQRVAKRTTISNVNSSDRATGNPYSSGYGSSRQAGGWGAGNKPKKGVGRSTGGSIGKTLKGLKWFNGKD